MHVLDWDELTNESQCNDFLTHHDLHVREPTMWHDLSLCPYARIAADLCYFNFSNFIEVVILSTENSKAVIRSLMAMFSRYRVPDSPQQLALHRQNLQNLLVSKTFDMSIRVPVHLFTKCRAAGVGEFLALLDWRNTPCEGLDTNPALRFFGCCARRYR